MGIVGVDLEKINIGYHNNFYEDNPETLIHVRLLAWRNKFEKRKPFKKYNQRINACSMASNKWWDWCMSKDDKKRTRSNFY